MIRVGLYYDVRNPGPARPWPQVYADTLRRIGEAEDRGVDAVWLSEHHGFADGYLPAPLTFAAAVAARTTRVRIGTAVALAPLTHPLALAEQAAVVDILSGGRLELGLGAGWREPEFAAFGADFRGRYDALERAVGDVERFWRDGTATPPPVQRPMPMWVGARGPRGARIAGRTGAGLLWIDPELLGPYRDGLAAGGHPEDAARMGGLVNVFLADDPDAARERIRPAGRHNRSSYSGNDRAAARSESAFPRLTVLTVQDAAAHIAERTAGLPVTDVFCFGDIGGLDPDLVDRHVELVATLPALLEERTVAHAAS
ncbi:LLM class flavin-dependent oxidoreductase [Pseudonocardia nigra]|uniref:LLM class flavin-dependent oxidoreductase n=1 Tax=Pseudonocardia nigra TaxID=1921578 RepID=UPI0027E2A541|nr:LLM class flavin-dependent oxidoreductase [Pseudonocardia nigra]